MNCIFMFWGSFVLFLYTLRWAYIKIKYDKCSISFQLLTFEYTHFVLPKENLIDFLDKNFQQHLNNENRKYLLLPILLFEVFIDLSRTK